MIRSSRLASAGSNRELSRRSTKALGPAGGRVVDAVGDRRRGFRRRFACLLEPGYFRGGGLLAPAPAVLGNGGAEGVSLQIIAAGWAWMLSRSKLGFGR